MVQAQTVAAGAALTIAAASIAEFGDLQGPCLLRGTVPSLSAIAAAETVTLQWIRNDTGAVIGSSTFTNSGAGASTGGPLIAEAFVPAGAAFMAASLQILASSATGNWVASATAPVVASVTT